MTIRKRSNTKTSYTAKEMKALTKSEHRKADIIMRKAEEIFKKRYGYAYASNRGYGALLDLMEIVDSLS